MNKAQRTRLHILQQTAPLFNMKGYDGTSLTDLCDATGLTKGALYGNFRDKDDLAIEAFRYTIGKMRTAGSRSMRGRKGYKRKLQSLLSFFIDAVLTPPVPGGCPLLNTAVDADDHRTTMKSVVHDELRKSVKSMTKLLDGGKKAGEFKTSFNTEETALFFFCAIEGAIMFSRVAGSADPMRTVTKQINKMIASISMPSHQPKSIKIKLSK